MIYHKDGQISRSFTYNIFYNTHSFYSIYNRKLYLLYKYIYNFKQFPIYYIKTYIECTNISTYIEYVCTHFKLRSCFNINCIDISFTIKEVFFPVIAHWGSLANMAFQLFIYRSSLRVFCICCL